MYARKIFRAISAFYPENAEMILRRALRPAALIYSRTYGASFFIPNISLRIPPINLGAFNTTTFTVTTSKQNRYY